MSRQQVAHQVADYFRTRPIERAWLFGSFARDEETPQSDVDLLVEFDHSQPIGLFAYARMRRELAERLGRKVDLVEAGTLLPFATASAEHDKRLIYERENKGR
ncbi:MAG: nucleotidyltransferase family protein [Bacteroidaceae bacterium]|nr:nucleotidyltransferase family protein [Bacteroidaceae bacterium]